MLSDEAMERLAEAVVDIMEEANKTTLQEIGKAIKKLGRLKESDAYKLAQELKYGGSYKKIIKELAKMTNLSQKKIMEIFKAVAKNNQQFAKQFYKYRNIDFIPYEKNEALKRQVEAMAKMTQNTYTNLSRTAGYVMNNKLVPMQDVYRKVIDQAVLTISQGKSTYQEQMRKLMKEMTEKGVRTRYVKDKKGNLVNTNVKVVDYASGRSVRLDSAIRMNMMDGIGSLSNQLQEDFGKEFGADGVEITVHENPAPDHKDVQGRQFSTVKNGDELSEWEKLQSGKEAVDYKGNTYTLDHDHKNGYRPISKMNCYHNIYSIVLGISKPQYSDEDLKKLNDRNEKGFDFEGKHYTRYQGTQLQRNIETKIRTLKDQHIGLVAMGDMEEAGKVQGQIRVLSKKYNELCKASGLSPRKNRMAVSGYKRISTSNINIPKSKVEPEPIKEIEFTKEELLYMHIGDLSDKGIDVEGSIMNMDDSIVIDNLEQLNNLAEKYPTDLKTLKVDETSHSNWIGEASYSKKHIILSKKYFADKNKLLETEERCAKSKWHYDVPKNKQHIYTMTHEYGHQIEYTYFRYWQKMHPTARFNYRDIDKDIRDTIIDPVRRAEGLNLTEFKKKYWSGYATSKRNNEWFAETFAAYDLGIDNAYTRAFGEWLEDFYNERF